VNEREKNTKARSLQKHQGSKFDQKQQGEERAGGVPSVKPPCLNSKKIKRKSGQRFVLTPDKSGLCQSKTGNDFFLEQRRRSAINSTLMDNNP
jgi:hypothetical protein